MIKELIGWSKEPGLTLNIDETRKLSNFESQTPVTIKNETIERIQGANYLGQKLSLQNPSWKKRPSSE